MNTDSDENKIKEKNQRRNGEVYFIILKDTLHNEYLLGMSQISSTYV